MANATDRVCVLLERAQTEVFCGGLRAARASLVAAIAALDELTLAR